MTNIHDEQKQLADTLAALNEKVRKGEAQMARFSAHLELLGEELRKKRVEAQEKYGTDDPEQLAELAEQAIEENRQAVQTYSASIASVEQELAAMGMSL